MNRPDDKTLNSWLEGNLAGQEHLAVEAWAEANASELDAEFKCDIGWDALSDEKMASLSDSVEPPYPEFFNSKIQQAIFTDETSENVEESSSMWQKLRLMVLPAAVAALVAFYAGTQMQSSADSVDIVTEQSSVYVPISGIAAAVSDSTVATEIILEGLTPISDELDIATRETSVGFSPMIVNALNEIEPFLFY